MNMAAHRRPKEFSVSTIFGKIIRREIPAQVVYEDDVCLAFRDVRPQAPTHVLLIPKREISSLRDVTVGDQDVLGHLMTKVPEIANTLGLKNGFRLVVNCGPDGGQTVDHLHLHILGGRPLDWPPG